MPDNMHLVGDSAYPLLPNIMVPFRDNGHLTRRQVRLKGKWRRLKYLDIENVPSPRHVFCTTSYSGEEVYWMSKREYPWMIPQCGTWNTMKK
ncbi:hypothetical protein Trydic_g18313 [Trypoxylus dichotomus]